MTRRMQDSVNAAALMAGQDFYAGYVDGRYANVAAIQRRFPHARVVTITVLGGHTAADVADIETGDLTPQSGAQWALWRHKGGHHPTLYCNTSTRPQVEHECSRVGLALHRDYEIWEAHYDGKAVLPAGAVAKQYADLGPHGENVDLSVVADYWPGVDPAPHHGARFYPVQRGDSLASIAKKFGLTVADLEAMNPGIQSHPLAVGQQVKVRTGTA